eukprot:gene4337-4914_t
MSDGLSEDTISITDMNEEEDDEEDSALPLSDSEYHALLWSFCNNPDDNIPNNDDADIAAYNESNDSDYDEEYDIYEDGYIYAEEDIEQYWERLEQEDNTNNQ